MPRVLVLAIGNPLRSDDGVAWHVADELRTGTLPPDIEIITVHQLTPELADNISCSKLVIFVDAAEHGEPGVISQKEITAGDASLSSSHHFSPRGLLQLSESLYHAHPKAFLLSVIGKNFDHGESISPELRHAIQILTDNIRKFIEV